MHMQKGPFAHSMPQVGARPCHLRCAPYISRCLNPSTTFNQSKFSILTYLIKIRIIFIKGNSKDKDLQCRLIKSALLRECFSFKDLELKKKGHICCKMELNSGMTLKKQFKTAQLVLLFYLKRHILRTRLNLQLLISLYLILLLSIKLQLVRKKLSNLNRPK